VRLDRMRFIGSHPAISFRSMSFKSMVNPGSVL
jgi:hypothetical protein